MRRVAFYAPLKSPHSPVPSGEREMARNLMAAISAQDAQVDLVSDLRIFDKVGDRATQTDLHAKAQAEVTRLIQNLPQDTQVWVTYHNYYKAPDLIGPAVCAAHNLPYVQIESTRAKKRLTGPWADFAQAAHGACDAADVIFYLTEQDHFALHRDRCGTQKLDLLPPFLSVDHLPPASSCDGPMLSVGMMRAGDKLASYQVIAQTLPHLTGPWQLEIAGDGPARPQVEALMAPFGDKVRVLGQLDQAALKAAYNRASLCFWPGVNEAFGMIYLEAQAAGLPVVAQDRPGVRDVLLAGDYPTPEMGAPALAARLQDLLDVPDLRRTRGARAREAIKRTHLRPAATQRFWQVVTPLLENRP